MKDRAVARLERLFNGRTHVTLQDVVKAIADRTDLDTIIKDSAAEWREVLEPHFEALHTKFIEQKSAAYRAKIEQEVKARPLSLPRKHNLTHEQIDDTSGTRGKRLVDDGLAMSEYGMTLEQLASQFIAEQEKIVEAELLAYKSRLGFMGDLAYISVDDIKATLRELQDIPPALQKWAQGSRSATETKPEKKRAVDSGNKKYFSEMERLTTSGKMQKAAAARKIVDENLPDLSETEKKAKAESLRSQYSKNI